MCKNFKHQSFWQKVDAVRADQDQIAPEGAVWWGPTLSDIPLSILRNNCIESKQYGIKEFKVLGHLLYLSWHQLSNCIPVHLYKSVSIHCPIETGSKQLRAEHLRAKTIHQDLEFDALPLHPLEMRSLRSINILSSQ